MIYSPQGIHEKDNTIAQSHGTIASAPIKRKNHYLVVSKS